MNKIKTILLVYLFLSISGLNAFAQEKCSLAFLETKHLGKSIGIWSKHENPEHNSLLVLSHYGKAVSRGDSIKYKNKFYQVVNWEMNSKAEKFVALMDKEGNNYNLNLDQFPKSKWKLNKVTLGDVLKYENPLIVNRILRDHPNYTRDQAKQLFYEMKKWFFVKARAEMEKPDDVIPYIYDEIDEVDYAWHAFLLFTVHYQEFGQQYFSKMFQHTPSLLKDPESQRKRFYEYVRETLGENTYNSWFVEQNFNPHKPK